VTSYINQATLSTDFHDIQRVFQSDDHLCTGNSTHIINPAFSKGKKLQNKGTPSTLAGFSTSSITYGFSEVLKRSSELTE